MRARGGDGVEAMGGARGDARARGERDGGEVARDVDEVESTDVEGRRGAGKTREARRGETRGETMATSGGGEKGRAGDAEEV